MAAKHDYTNYINLNNLQKGIIHENNALRTQIGDLRKECTDNLAKTYVDINTLSNRNNNLKNDFTEFRDEQQTINQTNRANINTVINVTDELSNKMKSFDDSHIRFHNSNHMMRASMDSLQRKHVRMSTDFSKSARTMYGLETKCNDLSDAVRKERGKLKKMHKLFELSNVKQKDLTTKVTTLENKVTDLETKLTEQETKWNEQIKNVLKVMKVNADEMKDKSQFLAEHLTETQQFLECVILAVNDDPATHGTYTLRLDDVFEWAVGHPGILIPETDFTNVKKLRSIECLNILFDMPRTHRRLNDGSKCWLLAVKPFFDLNGVR